MMKEKKILRLSDFPHDNAIYVGTVRSPVSKGYIKSIEPPELPKGYVCIKAENIKGSKLLNANGASMKILADGEILYKGEPVALIAGPDRLKVDEISLNTNVIAEEEEPEYSFEICRSENIVAAHKIEQGNVDEAMLKAHKIVFGNYKIGAQDHYYSEPQGAAAAFNGESLDVFSSTQRPFHVQKSVAECLNKNRKQVVVHPTILGTHLDGKLWYPSLLACHVSIAADMLGKPAILFLSRHEDFLYTTKRAPVLASYKAGLDSTGQLIALDIRIMINTGAYTPFATKIVERAALMAFAPYSCQSIRIISRAVKTTLPPMGAFAGLGTNQVAFALERFVEDCASSFDIEPSEWRARHIQARGESHTGLIKRSPPYSKVMDKLLKISDYPRKHSSFELIKKLQPDTSIPTGYGIGLAFAPQIPAAYFYDDYDYTVPSIELTFSKELVLKIATSVLPNTIAAIEYWKKTACSILDIPDSSVIIEELKTSLVPDSGASTMSRSIEIVTKLFETACKDLSAKRFKSALPISIKKTERRYSNRIESPFSSTSWGGAVVELELDPIDQSPILRGIWMVVKAGRLISASAVKNILEHDAALALGLCLGERIDLTQGPATIETLRGYKLTRIKDTPPIVIDYIDDDSDKIHGIGELAYNLVPAAFANALSQAWIKKQNIIPINSKFSFN